MARAVVALVLLVAAAAVLVFAAAPVSSRVVTFGVSIGGNSAARVVFHTDIERALHYTCDWINSFPPHLRQLRNEGNATFTCALKILRDEGNATRVFDNYRALARDPSVDFVIAALRQMQSLSESSIC
jgi:hypothetical protein